MTLQAALHAKIDLARSYRDRLTPHRVARKAHALLDRVVARGLQRLPGPKAFHCPACDRPLARFHAFGAHTLCCPLCGSTDRERHLHLAIERGRLAVPEGATILHVAPSERRLSQRLARLGRLVKGDYEPARYGPDTVRVDLMDLAPAPSFDVVVLSHILEHVPDDRRALRQVRAKLPPGGQAWIQVPLIYDRTVEGAPGMTPAEREARFGGSDHLRAYGPDLADRLEEEGFDVTVIRASDAAPEDRRAFGVEGDVIFRAARR